MSAKPENVLTTLRVNGIEVKDPWKKLDIYIYIYLYIFNQVV